MHVHNTEGETHNKGGSLKRIAALNIKKIRPQQVEQKLKGGSFITTVASYCPLFSLTATECKMKPAGEMMIFNSNVMTFF